MSSYPSEAPAALAVGAEPTGAKRVRSYNARPRRRTTKAPQVKLDAAALAAKYTGDAQNKTQVRVGSFRVPMGIGWSRWEKSRDHAAEKFLAALDRQGWQVDSLTAKPGTYPYRDVLTGKDDWEYREMHLVAVCGLRKAPEAVLVTIED